MKSRVFLFLFFFITISHLVNGQASSVRISQKHVLTDIGENVRFYLDKSSSLTIDEAIKKNYIISGKSLSVFGTTDATVWGRFKLKNETEEKLILSIGDPSTDTIELYFRNGEKWKRKVSGDNLPPSFREAYTNYYLFELELAPGEEKEYFLRANSSEPLVLSLKAGTSLGLLEENQKSDTLYGIYFGFMLLVILYNLFLFWGVKDNIYLFYVFYACSLAFTTVYIKGYDQFLLPELSIILNNYPVLVYSTAILFSMLFSMNFLHTRKNYPVIHKVLITILALSVIPIFFDITGKTLLAVFLFQILAFAGCVTLFISGIIIYRKGYRPAKFYILAWTSLLSGVAITILSDNQIIPSNAFSTNSIFWGSALEALLLSFALSDKINSYKEDKVRAEKIALAEALKNEKLVKEQNRLLEYKVQERTSELEMKNLELNKQKEDLKELNILKDKLFSIISHDLRGPLNSLHGIIGLLNKGQNLSDIGPVINDLKNTISTTRNLLDNVLHWAIANIKGASGKYIKINVSEVVNECMDLLKYSARVKNIELKTSVPEDLEIESDINMVRLVLRNLLSNAIKFTPDQGSITIKAETKNKETIISVTDSGTGISKENIQKLFDIKSTFSTRGTQNEKGSGIGLILCKEFLNKNNGKIWVESIEGKGSSFRFSIPVKSREPVLINS